jgi:hypothetical protein
MLFDWDVESKPTWEHLLRSWSRAWDEIEGMEKEPKRSRPRVPLEEVRMLVSKPSLFPL